MAPQPNTKTDGKTKKSNSTTSKPEAAKAEAPDSTSEAGSGGKKSSVASRPPSYFSCVSNDDYRSGWDKIFGSGGKNSTRKPVKSAAVKRSNKLPTNITLDADDLDPATREQLEAVFRRHAKKKRLNYDKLSSNGQVSWRISCRISNT
ncbi:MAG: hypothetical protein O6831_02360 [Alphaproteobacteria bacterium]|nr:hypothetical protein [Alphaproteobacteria bacterium]